MGLPVHLNDDHQPLKNYPKTVKMYNQVISVVEKRTELK